jgi:phosphohistidine phosphatase
MEVYLLRHADAVPRGTPGYPNDDRPLTEEGVEKMAEGAIGIAKVMEKVDVIVSSPLTRALDTAKITAEALGFDKKIITTQYLIPGYPQRSLFDFLQEFNKVKSIMLVGHEPHLGYLASSLLGIEEHVIDFKKGGLCRIDIEKFPPNEKGKLQWHLTPKQLIGLGKKINRI